MNWFELWLGNMPERHSNNSNTSTSTINRGRTARPSNKNTSTVWTRTFMTLNIMEKHCIWCLQNKVDIIRIHKKKSFVFSYVCAVYDDFADCLTQYVDIYAMRTALYKSILRFLQRHRKREKRTRRWKKGKNRREKRITRSFQWWYDKIRLWHDSQFNRIELLYSCVAFICLCTHFIHMLCCLHTIKLSIVLFPRQ